MATHPGLPGHVHTVFRTRQDYEDSGLQPFQIDRVDLVGNTGTYLDSPFHRFADGADLAALPLAAVANVPIVLADIFYPDERAIDEELLARRTAERELTGTAVCCAPAATRTGGRPPTPQAHATRTCNLLGSAGLAAVAAAHAAWPSVALNAALLAIAATTWRRHPTTHMATRPTASAPTDSRPADQTRVRCPRREDRLVTQPIDLAAALSGVEEPWSPRTVATLNDYDLRVVKTHGEFTRHQHPETDEVFLVLAGSLTIRLDDGEVTLRPGQLYVVPRGVHHQPTSAAGAQVLLIEPSATVNTGDTPSALTAERRLA